MSKEGRRPSLRPEPSVAELVARAREGDPRSIARLITLVENGSEKLREVAEHLMPYTGHAQVLGLTGSPGVGKSTSTAALISAFRAVGKRVGVLAVDPSSPFSGGALLGDRIRMQEHSTDRGVFIRSMATRGHLGGLSAAVPQALRVLDAAGIDVVLVETVGVGQSEIEIVKQADTTIVLLAPGMGDGIQAAKAGILEIADIFVINKADREGADKTVRELRTMQTFGVDGAAENRWRVPVIKTVAVRNEGVAELVNAIEQHRQWLVATGELRRRRQQRAGREIEAIAVELVRRRFSRAHGMAAVAALADQVADGSKDPFTAADELVASWSDRPPSDGRGLLDFEQ